MPTVLKDFPHGQIRYKAGDAIEKADLISDDVFDNLVELGYVDPEPPAGAESRSEIVQKAQDDPPAEATRPHHDDQATDARVEAAEDRVKEIPPAPEPAAQETA